MADLIWRLLEALWFLVAGVIALSFFAGIYLIGCGPGLGLLWCIKRWRNGTPFGRALAVAAIHAIFFAPAVILAHTPLIVTVFVGAIVYYLIDGTGRAWWLAASGSAVFAGSLVYQYLRSNFRLQRTPANGRR